jgi:hypothetical protein
MIALFLVGICALPLAQLPMRAMQQEYKSAYRMQAQRLADLAFAAVKEQLYRNEISWKEIVRDKNDPAIVLDKNTVEISFDDKSTFKFTRLGTLYSVGKKTSSGEEWRLVTFRVKMTPVQKGFKLFRSRKNVVESRIYTYQVVVHKESASKVTPETIKAEVPHGA